MKIKETRKENRTVYKKDVFDIAENVYHVLQAVFAGISAGILAGLLLR